MEFGYWPKQGRHFLLLNNSNNSNNVLNYYRHKHEPGHTVMFKTSPDMRMKAFSHSDFYPMYNKVSVMEANGFIHHCFRFCNFTM